MPAVKITQTSGPAVAAQNGAEGLEMGMLRGGNGTIGAKLR